MLPAQSLVPSEHLYVRRPATCESAVHFAVTLTYLPVIMPCCQQLVAGMRRICPFFSRRRCGSERLVWAGLGMSASPHHRDLVRLYDVLSELGDRVGRRMLNEGDRRMNWSSRGVYFSSRLASLVPMAPHLALFELAHTPYPQAPRRLSGTDSRHIEGRAQAVAIIEARSFACGWEPLC